MDDAEFAVSIDPNNLELRKQYSEIKALHTEKMAKRTSVPAKRTVSEYDKTGDQKNSTSYPPSGSQKGSFMEVDSPGRAAVDIRECAELRKIWDQIFLVETATADQVEALRQLRAKYIQGG